MRKVLVEFNLESSRVSKSLDITKLTAPVVVTLDGGNTKYISSVTNPHLPWIDGDWLLFQDASYETRFIILMEK